MIILPTGMQRLPQLGLLRIKGADARTFLQGQLSNDLDQLTGEHTLLATCNSAQGRVQALLTLINRGDEILAVLPRSMIERASTRLRKYVMRSKVTVEDATSAYSLLSSSAADPQSGITTVGATAGTHLQREGTSFIRWRDAAERWLVIAPAESSTQIESLADGSHAWHIANVRAGLPQVYPETHETFIAQMLNLDVLDAISFTKGCYTGQEIIARTHYLGAIKRRMFRLHTPARNLIPGIRILNGDQHAGDVVDAVETNSGTELLAVLSLAQQDASLTVASDPPAPLTRLSLPYSLTAPAQAKSSSI
jgi:folate-binding protein YgfZ